MDLSANTEEDLAWAAGLLDGDGSFSHSAGYAMVSVGGTDRELLERFARVVGGGNVSGPYTRERAGAWNKKPFYFFQAYRAAHEIARKLWPYVGTAKKTQIRKLQRTITWRAPLLLGSQVQRRVEVTQSRIALAWAAGFFDAEGCFSFNPRTGICVSITNTDRDQLERFLRAIGIGIGRIYGPYRIKSTDGFRRKPQYFYRAQGNEKTQALAAMLWFKLGTAKKAQAHSVLAHVRTTCRRGHPKTPGHRGCRHCTRAYWQARRDGGSSTAEPTPEYLIA